MKFEDLEIWDHIPGYDKYKVSSKGRVWSDKSNKFLKPVPNEKGYHTVSLRKDGKTKRSKIHRLVALTFYFINDDDDISQIDHIDRNKSNNNLFNLRFCTDSGNGRNQGIQRNNTSGYKGVSWSNKAKQWLSQIQINKKGIFLGYFNTKEEAYEAYKKASKEYHGDFAYTP